MGMSFTPTSTMHTPVWIVALHIHPNKCAGPSGIFRSNFPHHPHYVRPHCVMSRKTYPRYPFHVFPQHEAQIEPLHRTFISYRYSFKQTRGHRDVVGTPTLTDGNQSWYSTSCRLSSLLQPICLDYLFTLTTRTVKAPIPPFRRVAVWSLPGTLMPTIVQISRWAIAHSLSISRRRMTRQRLILRCCPSTGSNGTMWTRRRSVGFQTKESSWMEKYGVIDRCLY